MAKKRTHQFTIVFRTERILSTVPKIIGEKRLALQKLCLSATRMILHNLLYNPIPIPVWYIIAISGLHLGLIYWLLGLIPQPLHTAQ